MARITSSSDGHCCTGSDGELNLSLSFIKYRFLSILGLCCPGQLSRASETGLSPQVNATLCVDSDSACNVFCCCLFLVLRLFLCPIMAQKTAFSFPTSWALRVARCPSTSCEKMTSETGRSGFECHCCPLLALWSGASYLTAVSSCFLICKVRIITLPRGDCWED